jgi:hypothetical protein
MFNLVPILIGAAVGAGTSALFGKDPLKGAALGGLGGGLFGPAGSFGGLKGGVGNLINGIGTNALAGGDVAKGLAINASALGGAQGLGAATVPSAAQSAVTQAGLTFNPATGSFLNPEYFALANTANPIYTGAGGIGSQISTGIGSLLDTPAMQGLREYMPSSQAIGKLGIDMASQSMMRPPQFAPAGGVSQGKPLDIAAVENLLKGRRQAPTGLISDYFG